MQMKERGRRDAAWKEDIRARGRFEGAIPLTVTRTRGVQASSKELEKVSRGASLSTP